MAVSLPCHEEVELGRLLACCTACATPLRGRETCEGCGRLYPSNQGILEAIGPLRGRNAISARFYDGSGWQRFRPWEHLFLWFQGGQRRARHQILKHLTAPEDALVLEVGIGEGENLRFLPSSWSILGVDLARGQLARCLEHFPSMSGRLFWAEAEHLPFPAQTFHAVYSIGGFNYFRDHEQALREMQRVARPDGSVVVADEIPGLRRFGPGHLLGLDLFDRLWLRGMGLDADFVSMVLDARLDFERLVASTSRHRRFVRHHIWNRLGYCLVSDGCR